MSGPEATWTVAAAMFERCETWTKASAIPALTPSKIITAQKADGAPSCRRRFGAASDAWTDGRFASNMGLGASTSGILDVPDLPR
jgi:hypothetical protein